MRRIFCKVKKWRPSRKERTTVSVQRCATRELKTTLYDYMLCLRVASVDAGILGIGRTAPAAAGVRQEIVQGASISRCAN